MALRTKITLPIAQNTTLRIIGVIKDESGSVVPGANLTTLTLTLYDSATEEVINSRLDSNINGTNGGTVDSLGNFALKLSPADNALIGTGASEKHIALVEWTYNSGADGGRHEIVLTVVNIVKAP